jgi:methanol--5-hydroxybenzimidazolylcobamide Co-methyltransferase
MTGLLPDDSPPVEPETVAIGRRLTSVQAKRRWRLIEAARLLANEGGYEAVTIDAVCRRARVARGTVYHYFGSKDHLLAQVLFQWVQERSAELRRNPPVGPTLLDRVVESFAGSLAGVLREPKLFRAAFQALFSTDPGVIHMNGQLASITADYFEAVMNATPGVNTAPLWMVLRHVYFSLLVAMVAGRVTPEMLMNEIATTAKLLLESPGVCGNHRSPEGREKEASGGSTGFRARPGTANSQAIKEQQASDQRTAPLPRSERHSSRARRTERGEMKYTALAIANQEDLIFGNAPQPLHCGFDLTIGGGEVYPEINFTLPTMSIDTTTWKAVIRHYRDIGEMITRAARRLKLRGLVVEFELLPPMTEHPDWGSEITEILYTQLKDAHEAFGLRSALRVTPTDIRDAARPPLLRSGKEWETLCHSLASCAASGAHILSIESVGGKEVHDQAMMYGDVRGIIFALGILAPRDMKMLWDEIVSICSFHHVIPGADSACGFANTAMQLASQSMLPEVLASVVRAASSARSLVAFECGAQGPSKDCAYEGPVIKAITGVPISMEGKSASCAHFSSLGNIAGAMCDLWSNESVQNIRLLSGYAPEAYLELLAYDCRLFNESRQSGFERSYRDLLVQSDLRFSPQALMLSPASTIRIASAIVREDTPYRRTVAAAREACAIIRGQAGDSPQLDQRECEWLTRIERELDRLPDDEEQLIQEMVDVYGSRFRKESYGL